MENERQSKTEMERTEWRTDGKEEIKSCSDPGGQRRDSNKQQIR